MSWINPILGEVLKHFLRGENTSLMVSYLRGNKKVKIINNLAFVGLVWLIRIAIFGCLYVLGYILVHKQYPTNSFIIFLVVLWFALSLVSAILIASEAERDLERKKSKSEMDDFESELKVRLQDMNNVTLYYNNINKSLYFGHNYIRKSLMGEELIKESIGFIEVILKSYRIDPMPFISIEPEDVKNYLDNICIIRDFIISAQLEEAKQVRIRWNTNHMPS